MEERADNDADLYFAYSASLRIFGAHVDFNAISQTLGLSPTYTHRKGEKRIEVFKHDMWLYQVPVDENEALGHHIDALWATLQPHAGYLLELKKSYTVDIFLGYRSNSCTAGFEIPSSSLVIFVQLDIPLGVSVIIT